MSFGYSIGDFGSFVNLHLRLHMDALKCQTTVGHVKKAHQTHPQGINGLEDTYENAVQRIKYKQQGDWDLTIRPIVWPTNSSPLLSKAAIRQALAINEDML